MNTQQDDLVYILPERPSHSKDKELYDIAVMLKRGNLKIPKFQRDFCWTKDQVVGWIESVVNQKAIGVIVTYQLKGGGDVFLADGLQRLTATNNFIDDPTYYGFPYSTTQAIEYCKSFDITVQHRIYIDHIEAMRAFQKLNSGTSLIKGEFYAGDLSLSSNGETITKKIPEIIEKYELPLVINKKSIRDRKGNDKLVRDCYALFLQYISKTTSSTFWDSGTSIINSKKPIIERELSNFLVIEETKKHKLDDYINNFDSFIAEQVAEIRMILKEAGGEGIGINKTVMRWMLHLSIWRKNNGKPYQMYRDLIYNIFKYQIDKYKKINSKFEVRSDSGKDEAFVLQLGKLDLSRICRVFNSELNDGLSSKRKKGNTAPGYHNSHVEPFSQVGNGPTFPEPGLRNRARGAKPVQPNLFNTSEVKSET